MASFGRTRVVLIDDHEAVRDGLKAIVAAQPDMEVVAEASDAGQAVRAIRASVPDVVLMDVSIPGSSGVSLTMECVRAHPSVRVIGVSRHNEPAVMNAMLQAGAHGYVLKQNALSQLPAAIRSVATGTSYVDATFATGGRPEADVEAPRLPTASTALTRVEEDVLRLVAFSHTHTQIAARLAITLEETMTLKASAMNKAQLSSRIQIMMFARSRGWFSKESHCLTVHHHDARDS